MEGAIRSLWNPFFTRLKSLNFLSLSSHRKCSTPWSCLWPSSGLAWAGPHLTFAGAPELNTVLLVGSHENRVEEQNHLPWPAGHASFDADQVVAGHLLEIMHRYCYFRNGSLTKRREQIKRTLLNSLFLLKKQKTPNWKYNLCECKIKQFLQK